MTKKEAIEFFRANSGFSSTRNRNGRVDEVARREAWNNFTDMLCKEKLITKNQYENWDNPF